MFPILFCCDLNGLILPWLLYGAEVYGMNRDLTDSMQTLLNKALKGIVRIHGGPSTVPSSPPLPFGGIQNPANLRSFRKCFFAYLL
jgi:hypothetical protein